MSAEGSIEIDVKPLAATSGEDEEGLIDKGVKENLCESPPSPPRSPLTWRFRVLLYTLPCIVGTITLTLIVVSCVIGLCGISGEYPIPFGIFVSSSGLMISVLETLLVIVSIRMSVWSKAIEHWRIKHPDQKILPNDLSDILEEKDYEPNLAQLTRYKTLTLFLGFFFCNLSFSFAYWGLIVADLEYDPPVSYSYILVDMLVGVASPLCFIMSIGIIGTTARHITNQEWRTEVLIPAFLTFVKYERKAEKSELPCWIIADYFKFPINSKWDWLKKKKDEDNKSKQDSLKKKDEDKSKQDSLKKKDGDSKYKWDWLKKINEGIDSTERDSLKKKDGDDKSKQDQLKKKDHGDINSKWGLLKENDGDLNSKWDSWFEENDGDGALFYTPTINWVSWCLYIIISVTLCLSVTYIVGKLLTDEQYVFSCSEVKGDGFACFEHASNDYVNCSSVNDTSLRMELDCYRFNKVGVQADPIGVVITAIFLYLACEKFLTIMLKSVRELYKIHPSKFWGFAVTAFGVVLVLLSAGCIIVYDQIHSVYFDFQKLLQLTIISTNVLFSGVIVLLYKEDKKELCNKNV